MNKCNECGRDFNAQGSAWGGATCGDCIAAQIEMSLLANVLVAERKPMRRASGPADVADVLPGAMPHVANGR
jgi:hypothetical protein